MNTDRILTERLELLLPPIEEVLAGIEAMSQAERAHVSEAWLDLVRNADTSDPWIHGFTIVHRTDELEIGQCGFKGPPNEDGEVEIAYGIHPEHQCRGYATEAAAALVAFAFAEDSVRAVLAHTLPEENASTRVLTKCGFENVGEVIDPDDGQVWRWRREG